MRDVTVPIKNGSLAASVPEGQVPVLEKNGWTVDKPEAKRLAKANPSEEDN